MTSFASGFAHPLALLRGRRGGLLVADWGRGVVYRIAPADAVAFILCGSPHTGERLKGEESHEESSVLCLA